MIVALTVLPVCFFIHNREADALKEVKMYCVTNINLVI